MKPSRTGSAGRVAVAPASSTTDWVPMASPPAVSKVTVATAVVGRSFHVGSV
nr:hypothetical protein [Microbacterium sp. CIAB417]